MPSGTHSKLGAAAWAPLLAGFSALVAAGAVPGPASAQSVAAGAVLAASAQPATGGATASPGAGAAVSELLVTATRRERSIQDVPISVAAYSGTQLDVRHINDLNDLSKVVPEMSVEENFRGASAITLRGATTLNPEFPSVDEGVAVFIDDVPTIGGGEMRGDFSDLDRLEVLRGPQGTLFGRNVTGGMIALHTADPSFTPEQRLSVEYGNYNSYRVTGLITGPLTSDLAGKISIAAFGHDGYESDPYLGRNIGKDSTIQVRGALLYRPNDKFRLEVTATVLHNSGDTTSSNLIAATPTTQPFAPGMGLASYPTLFYGPDVNNANSVGHGTNDAVNFTLNAQEDFGFATLTSITGFRYTHPDDVDANKNGLPAPLGNPYGSLIETEASTNRQITEEVRLASPDNQQLRWQGGIFLLASQRDLSQVVDTAPYFEFAPTFGVARFAINNDSQSYGVFAEGDYDLRHDLTLTLGGRYSYETRDGNGSFPSVLGVGGLPINVPFSADFQAFTPKATLNFKPTENLSFYATVARGFKAGGFDPSIDTPVGAPILCQYGAATGGLFPNALPDATGHCLGLGAAAAPIVSYYGQYRTTPFAPETVWNYEIGMRAEWFDHRLRTNVTGFDMEYTNLQEETYNLNCFCYITAVSNARDRGVELDLAANPLRWLTVGTTATLQDAQAFVPGGGSINTGGTPKTAANGYFSATWSLRDAGRITFGGDVTYKSRTFFQAVGTPPDPAYFANYASVHGLVNLRLDWASNDGDWLISLWGKNINDVRYIGPGINVASIFGGSPISDAFFNAPPTYGVTITRTLH